MIIYIYQEIELEFQREGNTMDKELFKQMFSEYCRNEVNAGHCDDGDCQWCAVNMAWDKIFCCDEEDCEED